MIKFFKLEDTVEKSRLAPNIKIGNTLPNFAISNTVLSKNLGSFNPIIEHIMPRKEPIIIGFVITCLKSFNIFNFSFPPYIESITTARAL